MGGWSWLAVVLGTPYAIARHVMARCGARHVVCHRWARHSSLWRYMPSLGTSWLAVVLGTPYAVARLVMARCGARHVVRHRCARHSLLWRYMPSLGDSVGATVASVVGEGCLSALATRATRRRVLQATGCSEEAESKRPRRRADDDEDREGQEREEREGREERGAGQRHNGCASHEYKYRVPYRMSMRMCIACVRADGRWTCIK